MKHTIDELRKMAAALLSVETDDTAARQKWGEDVRTLLQELSIYHFELEYQNAALEQSEHDLAESRGKYIELFENAPVGYVTIDRTAKIEQANRTFSEGFVSAYPGDAAVAGRNFREFVCPEYHDAFERYIDMILNSGSIVPVEIKLMDFAGRPRFVTLTAGKRQPGDRTFRLAVIDINNRKKLEIQLLAAQKQAAENDRKKSQFLTRINHELRTPLTTLSGYCDMLSAPGTDAESMSQYLSTIKSTIESMRIVSDEVTDLAMLNSGSKPLECAPVDMEKLYREHAKIAEDLMREKDISIVCEIHEMPVLLGDPARLEFVVHSILRHAVENTTGASLRLGGRFERNPNGAGTLILELSGHGIGIETNIPENSPSPDCAWIEIFLARQVLNFMHGRILGTPARDFLRIEIPLMPAPVRTEEARETEQGAQNGQGPRTCLLVDDVILNLKVLAALMRKIGCVPVIASSGREALQSLARNRVDMILTDLWMPEMNGMEFAMNVRQLPVYDGIPIVAVTADVERTQNFDMRYFAATLIKPVSLAALKETLSSLMERT